MPVFFNNCRCRAHAALYGSGAFYDLSQFGAQANIATDLRPAEECVVATPDQNGNIEFNWFSFSREQIMDMPDKPGTRIRVFFGKFIKSVRLPKDRAANTAPYSVLFNVNGHFKRLSAIRRG